MAGAAPGGSGPSGARRTALAHHAPSSASARADDPYCTTRYAGTPATTVSSPGTSRTPQRPGCVKESHSTCEAAPSTAENQNHAAAATGGRPRRGRPCSTAYARPAHRRDSSAATGPRRASHTPTSAAATSGSTSTVPQGVCVTCPCTNSPPAAEAAKYGTSGANDPATRAEATSGPRPAPSRRTSGSTAAA